MTVHPFHKLCLAVGALVVTVACGGSDHGSPASPSPSDSGGGTSTAGATVTGTVSGGATTASVTALGAGIGGIKVSVEGTDLSTTTGSNGAFSLKGVPPGLVRLQFQGSGASGTVELSDVTQSESISISMVVNGTSVEVDSESRVTGSQAQLEGKITAANYAGHSLVVAETTVNVPDGVEITNGYRQLELTDLIVGARVHVKGTREGSAITASSIIVQQTGLDAVNLDGVLSDLGGTCPGRTFKFGSTAIAVNASTLFVQGSCADLRNQLTLHVRGLRRPDGSILATQVRFNPNGGDDDDDDEGGQLVQFSGAIADLSGKCPARTFQVGAREVRTNGSTNFLTPCATLANGQSVTIKGRQTGNGTVNAQEVQ